MVSSNRIESPFLNVPSFNSEVDPAQEAVAVQGSTPINRPFLSVYELDEWTGSSNPDAEEHAAFFNELYDEEFDEALFELAREAANFGENGVGEEREDSAEAVYGTERLLRQHFDPLAREVEGLIDAGVRRWGESYAGNITESEIDSFFDGYQPHDELSPAFENFWGSIKKGLKKIAKKAVDVAKKGVKFAANLALGPLLAKLKPLIRPLLEKVIRFAIGKLPISLRPIATQLGKKLGILYEIDGEEAEAGTVMPVISEIQDEFNGRMANLLFARDGVEQDFEVAQAVNDSRLSGDNTSAELDDARERFVQQLGRLKEDEDPTPVVQEFIPAILPALRIGIKVIGRTRVVNFLAGLLGKLIKKFVGPQFTPPLSKALVDAGLKLVQLESTANDESNAAATAVAATVEETVRRVSALPDYVLDNQELLEAFALEAFEQAATGNLPAILPEETYRVRPDLRESKTRGTWMLRPLRRRRKRFKKFSRIFKTTISPQKAAAIETFGGEPLSSFLSEQLGVPEGSDVEADVHLFETIEGSLLGLVNEAGLQGHAGGFQHGSEQLHPLTPQAAGILLGEPSLGREVDPRFLASPLDTQIGQRLFYLEVSGKRPLASPTQSGRAALRRRSHVKLVLDFPGNQIRVFLYLSEIRAQKLAVKLRQHTGTGMAVTGLRKLLERGLRNALVRRNGRLKVVLDGIVPNRSAPALGLVPSQVPQALLRHLMEWAVNGLADYFKQPQQFVKATEDTADGVTMALTVMSPPGLTQISQALKGKVLPAVSFKFTDGVPNVTVQVTPGHSHE
jgi:hypothetical protein